MPFLMLLLSVGVFAQRTKPKTQEKKKEVSGIDTIKVAQKNPILLLDEDDVEFVNKVPIENFLKDSLVFNLLDDPDAARMDSIWQRELMKSSLTNKHKGQFLDQEYNEVTFRDLPTDTLKKRLKLLNAKTPFNIEYNPLLENVIKSYLKRNKKSMEKLMALSTYYFPLFEQKLDTYNIPLEIKYLAIVESSLNPRAKSRVGATGLWQFMYATGKMHGLDVSSYVDERMDPVRSTEAAAKYLSTLYKVFGDWDLVLASYNSGPGNVSKAIRRSGGKTDYWSLRPYLPRETAGYVPAFIATLYLFEYAEEHGFQPPTTQVAYIETDTLKPKRTLTFDQISEVTGVDKELLQFLNPSYKLDVIPYVAKEAYSLRLPREKSGLFVQNEEAIYAYTQSKVHSKDSKLSRALEDQERITYRVKRGDFLGRIAEKYGVGVSKLKEWNNLRGNNLKIGQSLVIYSDASVASSERGTSRSSKGHKLYTVESGDSLWSISRKFPGLTVQQLRSWNNMNTNKLKPGMKIKVSEG